jgi:TonB family protein
MRQGNHVFAFFALTTIAVCAQPAPPSASQLHQKPDGDGVYYAGPEVSAPRLIRVAAAPYPDGASGKQAQGMTVLAMVIGADGAPAHLQVLHSHGNDFDQSAVAAVTQSKFEPGKLAGKPVPVWIDVRVVFRANLNEAVPEVVIAERDLPAPNPSQLEDKHHRPLSSTEPVLIHTVDADFTDPFTAHPYVQVAVVTVLVGADGLPKDVKIRRGLGFGLDKKAVAAVQHYRFLPATKHGQPIAATTDVQVNFATF